MLRLALLLALFILLQTASFSWSQLSSGPHIADVNILLPPKITHPVEYRLQGSDGCFKWTNPCHPCYRGKWSNYSHSVGISSSGEAFENSSSISLKWELSSCERLACWDDAHESERSKSSLERFLALKNDSGQCVVRATVDSHYSDQLQSSKEVLTDAIRLELVSTLRVNPEFNLLYFNPNAKVNLSITGGSCCE